MRAGAILFACAGACSYTRPADVIGGDGGAQADGASAARDAAADAAGCLAPATYGTPTFTMQVAVGVRSSQPFADVYQGALGSDVVLQLQVVEGTMLFPTTNSIQPGNYDLGAASDSDCGLCVFLGFHPDNNGYDDYYVARSGAVTLQQVPDPLGGGTLSGSMSNLHLVHVPADANHQPSGSDDPSCTTTLTGAMFSAPSTPG